METLKYICNNNTLLHITQKDIQKNKVKTERKLKYTQYKIDGLIAK
jgi:hypothetical protein